MYDMAMLLCSVKLQDEGAFEIVEHGMTSRKMSRL
jgi:hypothetical protein